MRSLPSALRALAQASVVTAPYPERTRSRRQVVEDARLVPGWEGALKHLEVERMEAIVRRYQGRAPRIENPFAAFPTRAYWLARMMNDAP